jgi:hypothetical protein
MPHSFSSPDLSKAGSQASNVAVAGKCSDPIGSALSSSASAASFKFPGPETDDEHDDKAEKAEGEEEAKGEEFVAQPPLDDHSHSSDDDSGPDDKSPPAGASALAEQPRENGGDADGEFAADSGGQGGERDDEEPEIDVANADVAPVEPVQEGAPPAEAADAANADVAPVEPAHESALAAEVADADAAHAADLDAAHDLEAELGQGSNGIHSGESSPVVSTILPVGSIAPDTNSLSQLPIDSLGVDAAGEPPPGFVAEVSAHDEKPPFDGSDLDAVSLNHHTPNSKRGRGKKGGSFSPERRRPQIASSLSQPAASVEGEAADAALEAATVSQTAIFRPDSWSRADFINAWFEKQKVEGLLLGIKRSGVLKTTGIDRTITNLKAAAASLRVISSGKLKRDVNDQVDQLKAESELIEKLMLGHGFKVELALRERPGKLAEEAVAVRLDTNFAFQERLRLADELDSMADSLAKEFGGLVQNALFQAPHFDARKVKGDEPLFSPEPPPASPAHQAAALKLPDREHADSPVAIGSPVSPAPKTRSDSAPKKPVLLPPPIPAPRQAVSPQWHEETWKTVGNSRKFFPNAYTGHRPTPNTGADAKPTGLKPPFDAKRNDGK